MTSNPQDRIVATILVDDGNVLEVLSGKHILEGLENIYVDEIFVTEAMLLQMNSFVRKRWEKSAEDLGIRKKDYPATPDECYPSF